MEEPYDEDVEDESAELNGGDDRYHGIPLDLDRLLLGLTGTETGNEIHRANVLCGGRLTGSDRFTKTAPVCATKLPVGHNNETSDVESSTNCDNHSKFSKSSTGTASSAAEKLSRSSAPEKVEDEEEE